MTPNDNVKKRIMDLIASAKDQRLRPRDVEKTVAGEVRISVSSAKDALNDLVEQGELVYAYRDPCSYVEFPCNGCQGGHIAARPMKVVKDNQGHHWLCDADADPEGDLRAQGCWSCGEIPFTRSG